MELDQPEKGATIFNKMTLGIMTLSIMDLFVTLCIIGTQHK